MKKILILIGIVLFSVALKGQEMSDTWLGTWKGGELKVVFHIVKSGDGYITTMDSPNQGAKNWHLTIKELPGLNHFFQTCEKGTVTEYWNIEQTFSPEALDVVGDWILRVNGMKK